MVPAVHGQDAGQFFDSNGVQIHYIDQGEGEPVVLVHGFLVTYVGNWGAPGITEALLTAGYRVIALDCRGHGQSGKPHDPQQYGAEMGWDVIRLMDHLGLERAHIVGYSMGAMITAHLLVVAPERFLTATLGGGAGRLDFSSDDREILETRAQELEQGSLRSLTFQLTPPGQPPPMSKSVSGPAWYWLIRTEWRWPLSHADSLNRPSRVNRCQPSPYPHSESLGAKTPYARDTPA